MRTPPAGKDWVAIILAVGLCTGVNCVTFAVLYDAIFSDVSGLSENATQLLLTVFGGIIGVLGSYVGYRAATADSDRVEQARQDVRDELAPPSSQDRPRLAQGREQAQEPQQDLP